MWLRENKELFKDHKDCLPYSWLDGDRDYWFAFTASRLGRRNCIQGQCLAVACKTNWTIDPYRSKFQSGPTISQMYMPCLSNTIQILTMHD